MVNYNYDKLGNRDIVVDSATTNYTPNNLNQYTDINNGQGQALSLQYDFNGNLLNDENNTYQYDDENRLIKATTANNIIEYQYDAFGRRIGKNIFDSNHYPLNAIRYVYDGDQIIAEYDGNNQLLRKYVYGTGIDEPIQVTRHTTQDTFYYHADGLGSIVALTDSSGATVESYEYDVYGNVVISDQTLTPIPQSQIGNAYLFTGRQFDSETGLYYYRARMYSPELGRFLQTDPIGYYRTMNLYVYCLNSPLNWIDPYGLDVWHIIDNDKVWGNGHTASIVGQDGYYTFHSYQPKGIPWPWGKSGYKKKEFDSFEEAMDYARKNGYDQFAKYTTNKCDDKRARDEADKFKDKDYNVTVSNCEDIVNEMMFATEAFKWLWIGSSHPEETFNKNRDNIADDYGDI